jgi:hypothetical protein
MDSSQEEHLLKDLTSQIRNFFNKPNDVRRELVIQASTWLLRERKSDFCDLNFFLEIETERRTQRYCLDNLSPEFMRECLGNGSARFECRGLLKSARLLLLGNLNDVRKLDVSVAVHAERVFPNTKQLAA